MGDDNGSFEESFTKHSFKGEVLEADGAGRWMERLPDLCDGILECSMDWKCDKFEPVIDNLVRRHLKEEFRSMVLEKYPSLGVVDSGISKDIKAPSFLLVVLPWIACSVVLFMVILCLFCFGRKTKLQSVMPAIYRARAEEPGNDAQRSSVCATESQGEQKP